MASVPPCRASRTGLGWARGARPVPRRADRQAPLQPAPPESARSLPSRRPDPQPAGKPRRSDRQAGAATFQRGDRNTRIPNLWLTRSIQCADDFTSEPARRSKTSSSSTSPVAVTSMMRRPPEGSLGFGTNVMRLTRNKFGQARCRHCPVSQPTAIAAYPSAIAPNHAARSSSSSSGMVSETLDDQRLSGVCQVGSSDTVKPPSVHRRGYADSETAIRPQAQLPQPPPSTNPRVTSSSSTGP